MYYNCTVLHLVLRGLGSTHFSNEGVHIDRSNPYLTFISQSGQLPPGNSKTPRNTSKFTVVHIPSTRPPILGHSYLCRSHDSLHFASSVSSFAVASLFPLGPSILLGHHSWGNDRAILLPPMQGAPQVSFSQGRV